MTATPNSEHTVQQTAAYYALKIERLGRSGLSVHDRITLGSVQAFLERLASDDLLAALAASLDRAREARRRDPATRRTRCAAGRDPRDAAVPADPNSED